MFLRSVMMFITLSRNSGRNMFHNKDTRIMSEISSKLTMKTPKRRERCFELLTDMT